jgi:hypothetical protein
VIASQTPSEKPALPGALLLSLISAKEVTLIWPLRMGAYNWLRGRGNAGVPTADEVKDFLSGIGQTPPFVYLCRCGTHMRIIRAIQQAAQGMK